MYYQYVIAEDGAVGTIYSLMPLNFIFKDIVQHAVIPPISCITIPSAKALVILRAVYTVAMCY